MRLVGAIEPTPSPFDKLGVRLYKLGVRLGKLGVRLGKLGVRLDEPMVRLNSGIPEGYLMLSLSKQDTRR